MDISEADILAVFEEETNVDSAKLQPSATLASLDIASLDLIGVSFALEDKFGVLLEADAFSSCANLGEVVTMIQAAARAKASASRESDDHTA